MSRWGKWARYLHWKSHDWRAQISRFVDQRRREDGLVLQHQVLGDVGYQAMSPDRVAGRIRARMVRVVADEGRGFVGNVIVHPDEARVLLRQRALGGADLIDIGPQRNALRGR